MRVKSREEDCGVTDSTEDIGDMRDDEQDDVWSRSMRRSGLGGSMLLGWLVCVENYT